ncbi:MAG: hypothetical protein ACKOX6_18290 [Bdellovibrio sp.]
MTSPMDRQIQVAFKKHFESLPVSKEEIRKIFEVARRDMLDRWMSAHESLERQARQYNRMTANI